MRNNELEGLLSEVHEADARWREAYRQADAARRKARRDAVVAWFADLWFAVSWFAHWGVWVVPTRRWSGATGSSRWPLPRLRG